MLAMTYRGPYRIRTARVPDPEILHPADAIVRVTRSAICGSDLHLYHGLVPDTRVGEVFGHEFTGIVEEVGPEVRTLKPGDHVLVPFNISCGTCYFCQREWFGNCHETNPYATAVGGIYGYSHTAGGYQGGQAEYVRVPFADAGPVKIPDGMLEEDALMCTDAFPTGYQAAEQAEIKQGDTVVVYGAGPVGLFAAKSAWFFGAGRVIVVDNVHYRLEFAKKFAHCETVNFDEVDDITMTIKKMTDWLGADACIDAVGCEASGRTFDRLSGIGLKMQAGSPTAIAWAINTVRKCGVVSIMGVYGPPFNMIPIGTAMNKGLTLRMNQASVRRNLPRVMEHVLHGHIRPSEIITHRIPLEEVAEGYHRFSSKIDNCIKTVLVPPRAMH